MFTEFLGALGELPRSELRKVHAFGESGDKGVVMGNIGVGLLDFGTKTLVLFAFLLAGGFQFGKEFFAAVVLCIEFFIGLGEFMYLLLSLGALN